MTVTHALVTFVAAAGLLTITPGLDTALVLRTAAVSGGKRAMSAGAGICLGCLTWGFAVSFGLGAVLSASQVGYDSLRIAGACYLVFLGVKMLNQGPLPVPTTTAPDSASAAKVASNDSAGRWLLRGLLTNLLNPKVGVFYVSFLPLFIPVGVNVAHFSLLLATIHATEGLVWFAVLVVATRSVSAWLRQPRVARTINQASGVVFIGFGVRLLLDRGR
jgi:threonine/homoserine/homoserine lactone efflux protein